MDKKLIRLLLILIGLIVFVIIFFSLINRKDRRQVFEYSKAEERLIDATKDYIKDNPEVAPKEGNPVIIAETELVQKGYLKEMSEAYQGEFSCNDIFVEVYYIDKDLYSYVPHMDCGAEGSNIKLSSKVIKDNEYGVVSGTGMYGLTSNGFVTDENNLYGMSGSSDLSYVFRGGQEDLLKNYVLLGNMLWRIVEIDKNDNMLLIYSINLDGNEPWDTRFNIELDEDVGINDYIREGLKSDIYQTLESFYAGKADLRGNQEFSYLIRTMTVPMDVCIGKRSLEDEGYDGSIECNEKIEDQNTTLLPAYMFMRASLDENCKTVVSESCQNYNYLSKMGRYWMVTTNTDKSNMCYVADDVGTLLQCERNSGVKPLILLSSNALYQSGSGTVTDPYRILAYDNIPEDK